MTSPPFKDIPVHLVLCSDVFLMTTTIQGLSFPVIAPFPRLDIYCDAMEGHWEDELLRVWYSKREVIIAFGSACEKSYWRDLLSSDVGYADPSQIAGGPKMISRKKRTISELCFLLDVPNPFTAQGEADILQDYQKIPKVNSTINAECLMDCMYTN
eukprot:m.191789 g.191789  ORF g.191789 m.191789 type:complete len:156 (-) comp13647_c2_seq9:9097-9564(-)